jgi:hypothetical protein
VCVAAQGRQHSRRAGGEARVEFTCITAQQVKRVDGKAAAAARCTYHCVGVRDATTGLWTFERGLFPGGEQPHTCIGEGASVATSRTMGAASSAELAPYVLARADVATVSDSFMTAARRLQLHTAASRSRLERAAEMAAGFVRVARVVWCGVMCVVRARHWLFGGVLRLP